MTWNWIGFFYALSLQERIVCADSMTLTFLYTFCSTFIHFIGYTLVTLHVSQLLAVILVCLGCIKLSNASGSCCIQECLCLLCGHCRCQHTIMEYSACTTCSSDWAFISNMSVGVWMWCTLWIYCTYIKGLGEKDGQCRLAHTCIQLMQVLTTRSPSNVSCMARMTWCLDPGPNLQRGLSWQYVPFWSCFTGEDQHIYSAECFDSWLSLYHAVSAVHAPYQEEPPWVMAASWIHLPMTMNLLHCMSSNACSKYCTRPCKIFKVCHW